MNRQKLLSAVRVGLLACVAVAALGCPTIPNTLSPTLSTTPNVVDFGRIGVEESIAIFNSGGGTLTWTATEDSEWLSIDKTNGAITTRTEHLKLTANRTGLAPGNHTATLQVNSNGGSKSIGVAVRVPGTPVFHIDPITVSFLGDQTEATIVLSNSGDDSLNWTAAALDPIDPTATFTPDFLTLSATNGNIPEGENRALTLTLDRAAMAQDDPNEVTLRFTSNGGTETVIVNISSAQGAELAVDPSVLDFGKDLSRLTFDVWNDGVKDSVLEFNVTTDRPELLFFNPTHGSSTGRAANLDPVYKDRVAIGVTIDRAKLRGTSDSAHVYVTVPGYAPIEILVTVVAAPITFEGATNRARPPFIARYIFTLRDSVGQTIDSNDPAVLAELQDAFTIDEDGYPIDLDETNLFVRNGSNLKYNIALLLDYTGSMFNAGSGGGIAIDQMVSSAKSFINNLPPTYRLSLMEYHERQQANRVIHGFSTSRGSVIEALDAYDVPDAEHGASEIFDAIGDACTRLANEDQDVLSFDDADVRSLVFISDGRDTSSIAKLEETITKAKDLRVRLYPIGFGSNVDTATLVQLATETGGHYYAAPTLADLANALGQDKPGVPKLPGLVVTDLSRQVVLTYITLFQEGSHTYNIHVEYRDQEGNIERDGIYSLGGDVRAGQLALTTAGIDDNGTAEVFLRADYIPRNVTQFRFRFITPLPYTLEKVADGLIADWTLVNEGAGVYTFLTTEDAPLRYGSFGNLLKLTFREVVGEEFTLGFRVDNQILVNPPFTKFFQYPLGTLVSRAFSTTSSVPPIYLEQGFDPDAADAWDADEDGTVDFDDLYPVDPDFQKSGSELIGRFNPELP